MTELITIKRERLEEYISDSVWAAYFNGIESGDKWQDGCISGAEQLVRELGLKRHVWHSAAEIQKLIPLLIDRLIEDAVNEALVTEFTR